MVVKPLCSGAAFTASGQLVTKSDQRQEVDSRDKSVVC